MASRTEAVNLRMNPKTKYFAQLIAKGRKLTFADLMELVLQEELSQAQFKEGENWKDLTSLMPSLWADHEADRLALIGNRFPHLLSVRERLLWEGIICKRADLWLVPLTNKPITVSKKTFNFPLLRECWESINLEREELRKQAELFAASLDIRIRRNPKPPATKE